MPDEIVYLVTCDGDAIRPMEENLAALHRDDEGPIKISRAEAALEQADIWWGGSRQTSNPQDPDHHRLLVHASSESGAIDAVRAALAGVGSYSDFAARPLRPDEIDFSAPAPWTLPVRGFEVVKLWFGSSLDIFAQADGPNEFRIMLSGAFDYRDSEANDLHLDLEHDPWESLVPLLALRHDRIQNATVSPDSVLSVLFESGRALSAAPTDKFANWEARGPTFSIEGTPGEPIVWTSGPWE